VTTEGWIFMVGFRVFDVGLLILWLVWFFRLRDDDDSTDDDGPGGGGPDTPPDNGPGGGGIRLPLGWARPGGRQRDHRSRRARKPRRGRETLPQPSPARVRQPAAPTTPAHRRP
jgi:hypothetical protein